MPRLATLRDRLIGLGGRIERLERHVQRDSELLKRIQRQLNDVDHNVQALVRATFVGEELSYPHKLTARRFRLWSQNDEDGLTLSLLREGVEKTRTFAELGCGDNGGDSGFLAAELGWRGLFVDADEAAATRLRARMPRDRVTVAQRWLERDTVDDVLAEHGVSGELDVLGIDIDGNDYWLWEAISVVSPRLVIIEYNSMFGPDRAVVVPYDARFRRRSFEGLKGTYYGASLQALTRLGQQQGYRLVAVEPRGVNAFFLRDDVAPHVPASDPVSEFRLLDQYATLLVRGFDLWRLIAERDLPLVDVGDRSAALSGSASELH